MARLLQLAAVLTACALPAAYASLPVTGRLTADDGVTVRTGRYRLEASLVTNATAGAVLARETVEVTTDADGYYAAVLPLSPANAFDRAETVYLCQEFRTPGDGAYVARLPAQRIGFAPYALYAGRADRLSAAGAASASLAVGAALSAGELVVSNRLDGSDVLIVTGAVETTGERTVVRVDRLALGAAGSALMTADGWAEQSCAAGEEKALSAEIDADGLFELELSATGRATVFLTRTTVAGRCETLVAREIPAVDGRARNWKVPVRAGETVAASVACGAGASARLRGRTVGFGRYR